MVAAPQILFSIVFFRCLFVSFFFSFFELLLLPAHNFVVYNRDKKIETIGKSVGMIAGKSAPTVRLSPYVSSIPLASVFTTPYFLEMCHLHCLLYEFQVISPHNYKVRFCKALRTYFMEVPSALTHLTLLTPNYRPLPKFKSIKTSIKRDQDKEKTLDLQVGSIGHLPRDIT